MLINTASAMRRSFATLSKKPTWRFRKVPDKEFRVLFAGPHFHAALPLVQHVLKGRIAASDRHVLKPLKLIHAPTQTSLYQHASKAHVAIPFMEHFPAEFFHQAPFLRLVIQFGVGLERVDVAAATEAGIAVSNIPADGTGNAEATSEHALFLTMSLLRHTSQKLPRLLQNRMLGGLPLPRTLYRKRVTVVGFGSVGKVLTRYLIGMGAHVTVVRNRRWEVSERESCENTRLLYEQGTQASSLNEALPTTDVLILAAVMTPETLHLMNDTTVALLPRGSLIVNVGRGPLVEYGAILSALKSGAVGGFASDVGVGHPTAPSEPWDPDDELSQLDNSLFTPHVGGYTDYSYDIMANKVVDAIECVIQGYPPPVWVNAGGGDPAGN